MAGPKATGEAPSIGIGMLGYAFMGKAHSNALKKLPYMMYPPVAIPKLVAIAGRNKEAVEEAAKRYGYAKAYTDWRAMVDDPEVEVFDNSGPNNVHTEPNLYAAKAGKHIISEKPLGRNAEESYEMWQAVKKAKIKHQVAFNYRFVPAIRLVKNLIDQGKLGRIYHFRASYLQEWIADENFPMVWRLDAKQAGSGALGDLGSHIIDIARFLVGEPKSLMARTGTFIKERDGGKGKKEKVTVDDAFEAVVEYKNGALGTLEASRFAPGRKNSNTFEINAEHGSVHARSGQECVGFHQGAGVGVVPPVLEQLVAAGSHHRLGAHVRAPVRPLLPRHYQQGIRHAVCGRLRGWLSQFCDLRRDFAERERAQTSRYQVLIT